MTRADKSRFLYVSMLLLLGGICLTIGWFFSFRPSTLIVIALLLAIPGRMPSLLWREFYTGATSYATWRSRARKGELHCLS
jgi:hypothetical protein